MNSLSDYHKITLFHTKEVIVNILSHLLRKWMSILKRFVCFGQTEVECSFYPYSGRKKLCSMQVPSDFTERSVYVVTAV